MKRHPFFFPLQDTPTLTVSFFENRDLKWYSRSGEMSLFDKLILGVCLLHPVFLSDMLSDVIGWHITIVQTVLYPTAKALLPRLTICVFSKAENLGCFLWSIWRIIYIRLLLFVTILLCFIWQGCTGDEREMAKQIASVSPRLVSLSVYLLIIHTSLMEPCSLHIL